MKYLPLFSRLALLVALPAAAFGQKLEVIEKTLPNGLRLLMVERHDTPSVAGGWVARVGSANERPGMTGIAHLFEHMLFKGSPVIGTRDYARDLDIIEAQERVREEMRREDAKMRELLRRGEIDDLLKPENQTPRYRELAAEFKKLVEEQRKILVKNEFDRIYTGNGGSQMNAYTSMDMTAYFTTVPANKLELWMWMESTRLWQPVFREFYAERDVVFEERRMRTDSPPLGRLNESFWAMFWESHPYSWPTVGWPSDIPAITKAQADEFFATYYSPENITLVLVGDFKWPECLKLVQRYFGRLERSPKPVPDVVTLEIKQVGEKRLQGEADANPQVDIMWHTPAFGHPDTYPLSVLSQLLSTRTGRLYKRLVLKEKLATEVFAANYALKYAGVFNSGGECADGRTPEQVEAAIHEEIERLKQEPVPAEELQKVKNNFAAGEYRKLSNNHAIMQQLLRLEGSGRWQEFNEAGPKLQAVTAADIRRVAGKYFVKENRAVATYTRKPGAKEDPEFAGLSPEQKPVIRQIVSALEKETDAAKLGTRLKQVEEQLAKADAKNQPFLKIMRQKLEARLKELAGK